jgi:hypothetical protein
MIPPRSDNRSWVRKVDGTMHIVGANEQPQTRWYPGDLTELLWIVTERMAEPAPTNSEAKACGSHWAMSKTAVTPGQMIETATPVHEWDGEQALPRLNHVLHEVIPGCMTQHAKDAFIRQNVPPFDPTVTVDKQKFYLFHVEAGMRIYELYSYMDSGDDGTNEKSLATYVEKHKGGLNTSYLGPWAVETMGGAGGQTIAGVASTATHGGDLASSAIGDAIVAIHLVAPNGQEYWIERSTILPNQQFNLVEEAELQKLYAPGDSSKPGGQFRTEKIIYLQDDDLMNAAIVSCGRMGIIYSVVVRAIRQFALREHIANPWWKDVGTWIANTANPTNAATFANHFVRIDVDVYPKPVFDWSTAAWLFGTGVLGGLPLAMVGLYAGIKGNDYRTWVITREFLPLDAANTGNAANPIYRGRAERAGANKGAMPALASQGDAGGFRDPCGSANWVRQLLQDINNQLESIRNDAAAQWLIAGGVIAASAIIAPALAAAARTYQGVLERVMLFCQVWILYLSVIQEALPNQMLFGDFVSALLNTFSDLHAHSIVQLLYWIGANTEHPAVKTAVSYAVMDIHNYKNKGCVAPGDSIEFFIDGTIPGLPSFIDYAINEVRNLADEGLGFGGYISIRFMKDSPSFLAMQRWPRTCSIEIAGLSKVDGCRPYLERLEEESRKRDIILHWGQRNNRSQEDLEKVFSPNAGGPLHRWREALSTLSEHGRLHNFSTAYSRHKGLEITQPRVYKLTASPLTDGCENETTTITYDARKNPPETELSLIQRFTDGRVIRLAVDAIEKRGTLQLALGRGRSTVQLLARRKLNGNQYSALPLEVELQGFRTGDFRDLKFVAEKRLIDSVVRWYVEMHLFSQFISNSLRVSEVKLTTLVGGDWIMRNPDIGADLTFTPASPSVQPASLPIYNRNWKFFSAAPATSFTAPSIFLRFTMMC